MLNDDEGCIFWIEFAAEENLVQLVQYEKILKVAKELTAIFVASRITAEKNLNRGNL